MTQFEIPCELFYRFSHLQSCMPDYANDWFKTIRIENGVVIASNRILVVAEYVGDNEGIAHIKLDPALIEQCRVETAFNSKLYITVNPALQFAAVKTSLGYNFPGNALYTSTLVNDMERWKDYTKNRAPTASKGAMFWRTERIEALSKTSPSGGIIFQEFIACDIPTIVRDVMDENWFGMFLPNGPNAQMYPAATLPDWVKK